MTGYERMAEEAYLRPPEERTVTYCEGCENEVYEGEALYLWGGKWICPECLKDDIIHMSAEAIAGELELDKKVVCSYEPC